MKFSLKATFSVFFLILISSCCNLVDITKNNKKSLLGNPSAVSAKSGIQGWIKSRDTAQPVKNILVRLAEVYRRGTSGAYILDDANSPGTFTNEEGEFWIFNIKASEYVIVIGDVQGSHEIIVDPSGKARVWVLRSDEIQNVGEVLVKLENW